MRNTAFPMFPVLIDCSRVVPCHRDSDFSSKANHSARYLPVDREWTISQSNLTLTPASLELAAVEHAAPAYSLIS